MAQIVLGGSPLAIYDNATSVHHTPFFETPICWHQPWNTRQARFEPCFVPAVAALPAVVAVVVVIWQALRIAVPWRPRWTLPFSTDGPNPYLDELLLEAISRTSGYLLLLWFLVGTGSIARLARAVIAWPAIEGLLQCVPWFLAISLLLVQRPRTTPISVLIILCSSVLCQSVVMANHSQWSKIDMGLDITALTLSILAVCIILLMPLRDPSLPHASISKPFTEATASLRSPEDNLNLWQFMTISWMTPLIQTGYKRQLDDPDVWQLGYEFQHKGLHANFRRLKGTVMQRLLTANGIDLVIITALGILETILGFTVPVLLQKILSSMQDSAAPRSAAITYAAITMGVQLIKCQSGVFSLWFGRRCYERSRGEMITMLYEKTLGRKINFNPPKSKTEAEAQDESDGALNGNGHAKHKRQSMHWLRSLFVKMRRTKKEDSKGPASMGKILNLMRNDVYEVAQRFWEFQSLITKPLSVVFSLTLVVNFLGRPALLAVIAMITAQVTNAILVRFLVMFETHRRKATDGKLQIVSQFVEAIRHLRWYGWQKAWLGQIMTARQKELNWRIVTSLWGLLISFINSLALDLSPSIGFFAYTVIGKKPLTVDIAFPALTLFNLLTNSLQDLPNLITVLLNAYVAVGRIEDFMAEPDKDEAGTPAQQGDSLAVTHATFAWPGTPKPVLRGVTLSFSEGLSVICGEVASGKTALLQALLGELDMLEGKLTIPREPVGYCSQTPWLQSMSIRENILFSAKYEDERYREVLDACALTPDLVEFKAGDLSFIGENGIGLSGGQKARVALARAAYSRSKILLLDDPLSALDQQTAESIVQKLFAGPLLKGRTVLLVTHRVDLVLGMAAQLIELNNGIATVMDNDEPPANFLQRTKSAVSAEETDHKVLKQRKAAAVPEKFIEDEYRARGGVKASVYWEYIKAGKLHWWCLLVITLVLYRLLSLTGAWLLKSWGEAYQTKSELFSALHDTTGTVHSSSLFDRFPPPDENIKPWVLAFFLTGLSRTVVWSISRAVMIVIIYKAGKQMFGDIMLKVSHANFRFYDVTPVGRLMNRMTSDVAVLDGNISEQFNIVTWLTISWISAVAVIATVTPVFLLFSVALTAAFILIFRRFLPTSQSLRRLEMVSLTPLMSNFGELLNGLVTVRAFEAQDRFQDRVIRVVDTFQKMDHFYWSLQAWLMYRYDALSAVSTFLLTLLALVTGVSPGLTAFLLNSAQKFVNSTHYLCRTYGQLQMEFVSVERVVELLHIEQEAEGTIHPPAWWPSLSGEIVFDNVEVKYAPHMDPALAGVSFTIKGGSKTAVIGRTGSGKSTLALTMLATILPSNGSITIDNIDLAAVDKQILRTRITFLAQDPVLFPGTMRMNLDPLEEHTNEACVGVLQRVCDRQGWSLETPIDGGGRNLSQGQRQLVGLARAVLRRSSILILDEATASIDMETAMQIQQVLHEEMKESTVITIAHRLEAVRGADYCLVLGKGRILEQGPAEELLRTKRERLEREADEE
jgi:ABC-type multidrug transport system fused ATPase/permease subunit